MLSAARLRTAAKKNRMLTKSRREALREHFARTGKAAEVVATADNLHRVRYAIPKPPKVSLILTSDEAGSADGFAELTDYPNLEIIKAAGTAAALNAAAHQGSGEILCFVDARLQPMSKDWLNELAGFATQDEIGAVGGKILSQNGTVEGSGVMVGGRHRLAGTRRISSELAGQHGSQPPYRKLFRCFVDLVWRYGERCLTRSAALMPRRSRTACRCRPLPAPTARRAIAS